MTQETLGTTALDRLRDRLDRRNHVCDACGYEHSAPTWEALTSGDRIVYRRECDSCGMSSCVTYRLRGS